MLQEDSLLPHVYFKPVSIRFITPCEFIIFLLTCVSCTRQRYHLLFRGQGWGAELSSSGSKGCLFCTLLSSPTRSNQLLTDCLHYIHSVLHCQTDRCGPDSLRLYKHGNPKESMARRCSAGGEWRSPGRSAWPSWPLTQQLPSHFPFRK